MGKRFYFVVLCSLCLMSANMRADDINASEQQSLQNEQQSLENELELLQDEPDYNEIQKSLDAALGEDTFDFETYVKQIMNGEQSISPEGMLTQIRDGIFKEIKQDRTILIKLLVIAVMGAVFTNFSKVFSSSQVADTGFYVTYLLVFSVITVSFSKISSLAGNTLEALLDFMKILLPAYSLTIGMAAGSSSAAVFYQFALLLIGGIELILVKVLLPLIHIYFVLVLVNNLLKEDLLSKSTELIQLVIQWSLKTMTGAVIGYSVIQNMVVPVTGRIKTTAMVKTVSVIPGVGDAAESLAGTLLGAGVIIKNGVGTAGMIAIVLIAAIPLGKIVLYVLMYHIGAAFVQPVSDERILNCLTGASEAASMLLYCVLTGGMLFLISIAIIMLGTNSVW